jgi:pilus assembly protein CpaE
MDEVARVVLALEGADVIEEVMHFLDRSGRARVMATAVDDRQLAEAVRQLEPDVVVAQPSLVRSPVNGAVLLAIDTRESIAALRAAIGVGADGFFVWPAERERLVDATARSAVRRAASGPRGTVITVHGSRGGAGSTFVTAELSAALARRGLTCIAVDADPTFGDLGASLGAPAEGARTLADLAPLGDEVGWSHVQDACWPHPAGFRALLAPEAEHLAGVDPSSVASAVRAAASGADVVVVDLPRMLSPGVVNLVRGADRLLEVLLLDVLSFRAAVRALDVVGPAVATDFVVNRAARGELTPDDVRRAFGSDPLAVLPRESSVSRAQEHGYLLPARGRIGRAFDRLAERVVVPVEEAAETA